MNAAKSFEYPFSSPYTNSPHFLARSSTSRQAYGLHIRVKSVIKVSSYEALADEGKDHGIRRPVASPPEFVLTEGILLSLKGGLP